ncbi:MAG TPA: hypothetical protein VGD79_05740, partial [Thermoanaerobaculia bacterium]
MRLRAHAPLVLSWAPLMAVVAAGLWFLSSHSKPVPTKVSAASLVPSSMRTRPVEARLSGLPWAPYVSKAPHDSNAARTRGESADVAQQQRQGLVELLVGNPRNAVATLERASASNDAGVWSDLAAAYYEAAVRHDAPEFLANALSAADRALAVDPKHGEALFNRALILERIGLRTDAHAAWLHYLATDTATGWIDEGRKHRDALLPERPFLEVLDESYDRIGSDPVAAAALYAR